MTHDVAGPSAASRGSGGIEQQEYAMGDAIAMFVGNRIFGVMIVFATVVALVAGASGLAVGRWSASPSKQQQSKQSGGYDDLLVHPETTPEVKWVKMTKPTRDTLLEIYAENMDECGRYMTEENGVTIGEAAIMWLMDRAEGK